MSQTPNSLKSICILRLSSIGDITHMIPIVKTLQKYSPTTDITWIIGKTEYSLVKNMEDIEFIVIDKKNFIQGIQNLLKLRERKFFDVLLHMQVSLRSNILSLLVKAERRIGFDSYNSKNFHQFFITESIKEIPKSHVLNTFFCFLEVLGIMKREYNRDIGITKKDFKKIDKFDKTLINRKYVVINPFTSARSFNYREWDIMNYIPIIKYLYEQYNLVTIITGSSSENQIIMAERICNDTIDVCPIYNFVGKTNLQELYNIISECEFYIGPDSGTLHIASILSKPVIGLFATSNPDRTGPFQNIEFIINKYPEALKKYNKKLVSDAKWGERVRDKKAMSLIKVDDVKKKIDMILRL